MIILLLKQILLNLYFSEDIQFLQVESSGVIFSCGQYSQSFSVLEEIRLQY